MTYIAHYTDTRWFPSCFKMELSTRWLAGPTLYSDVWQAMRDFTEDRQPDTADQLWLTEHQAVYTLGQAGKSEHILNTAGIAVVHSDRGGQVTYHGPGQLMLYCLVDLRRYKLYVKEYVELLEDVLISVLHDLGVVGACRKPGAPGVYVPCLDITDRKPKPLAGQHPMPSAAPQGLADDQLAKIAALGIKVRHGCAYHGLALNVDMDLSPFLGINPCGYQGLQTTDLRRCGVHITLQDAGQRLAQRLSALLEARRASLAPTSEMV